MAMLLSGWAAITGARITTPTTPVHSGMAIRGLGSRTLWGLPLRLLPYYSYESSIRLEVKPKEAEVYVDGYYAGIVDDFDGTFQRLHVLRGQHELTLYRRGFKSIHQNVTLAAGSTFKVKTNLDPLAPGETS